MRRGSSHEIPRRGSKRRRRRRENSKRKEKKKKKWGKRREIGRSRGDKGSGGAQANWRESSLTYLPVAFFRFGVSARAIVAAVSRRYTYILPRYNPRSTNPFPYRVSRVLRSVHRTKKSVSTKLEPREPTRPILVPIDKRSAGVAPPASLSFHFSYSSYLLRRAFNGSRSNRARSPKFPIIN